MSILTGLTTSSHVAGRYSMNSDKALNFDIKMTFGNELRCQRSAGFYGYISIFDTLHSTHIFSIDDF